MYECITCPVLLRMMNFLFSLRAECFITIRVFITKRVVTVYPNCNNVLPARFVINYYKTGIYYKTGCYNAVTISICKKF